MTTFCWLPPLSVVIGASEPAVRMPRRSIQPSTRSASRRRASAARPRRRPSIGSVRFSLTLNAPMTPSVVRLAGTRGMRAVSSSARSIHASDCAGRRMAPLTAPGQAPASA